MHGPPDPSDYFAGINKIVRFFKNTKGSGLLFCSCADQRMVREINRALLERVQANDIIIREVYIPSEKAGEFMALLREAADGPDGLIVNNLDELVLSGGKAFVYQINFARELLTDLNRPLLFWLTPENISVFANSAPDLFSRRDRGVIEFTGALTGDTALRRFDETLAPVYAETPDFKSSRNKIELLEKQYQEAVAKAYPEKRIALEIAADLIDAYLDVHLRQEALQLFERYLAYYEESSDPKLVWLMATVFAQTASWDKALEYYYKSEQIRIKAGDRAGLGTTYNNIGSIYHNKGEWDKALEYLHKSEQIQIEIGNRAGLGATYNNIGESYRNKGEWDKALEYYHKSEQVCIEIDDRTVLGAIYNNIGVTYRNKGEWDKALEYLHKSEQIHIEVGNRAGLGPTYSNIGGIYDNKDEWDKALEYYHKSEQILLEVGDRAGLGTTYNNIGGIYRNKGEWDKALEYLHKSEQIRIEVGDRTRLGTTYNNIGGIYDSKDEWDKALKYYHKSEKIRFEVDDRAGLAYTWFNIGTSMPALKKTDEDAYIYICAAAYLTESIGMTHEQSKMAWAIDPLIEKMGKKKVMKIGRKFYKQRLAKYQTESGLKDENSLK